MGELQDASGKYVIINRPIQVRMVPTAGKDGDIVEQPVITMYCQFSGEETYEFKNEQVVFCKELYPKIADFYRKTADDMYAVEVTRVKVKEADDISDAFKEGTTDSFNELISNIKRNLH